jgi:hypothetical protein
MLHISCSSYKDEYVQVHAGNGRSNMINHSERHLTHKVPKSLVIMPVFSFLCKIVYFLNSALYLIHISNLRNTHFS